jgi:hypothetical protein
MHHRFILRIGKGISITSGGSKLFDYKKKKKNIVVQTQIQGLSGVITFPSDNKYLSI